MKPFLLISSVIVLLALVFGYPYLTRSAATEEVRYDASQRFADAFVRVTEPIIGPTLGDILDLRQGIESEFGVRNTSVNLTNGEYLTVVLKSTSYNELDSYEKRLIASQIVSFIEDDYEGGRLKRVTIVFAVERRASFLFFNYYNLKPRGTFVFDERPGVESAV